MYDHIVLISIDTLRSDGISANPLRLWPDVYPELSAPATPVLDDLVGRGAFFANCVSAAPYTSASHATILSGKWPLRHGVFEFFNRKLGTDTLFTRAQRAGYATLLKSDFPLILGPTLGFDRGVDTFVAEDDKAYLASLAETSRSVSLVHFGGVHVPYGFHNLHYGGDAYRAKLSKLEADFGGPDQLPKDQLIETYRDEEDLRYLLRYKRVVQELWQADRAEEIFGLYLEGIEYFLATRFTPFIERLFRATAGRRTLVVLFGDHGEEYSAESFGHFNSVTEGVLRVPLLFFGDDVAPGCYTERVRTVEILPTIAELMGNLPIAHLKLDGASLASTVRDGSTYPLRPGFAQAYVADTAKSINFQQQLMNKEARPGGLPHVLAKEVVWDGRYRLTRELAKFSDYFGSGGLGPIEPVVRLERFDEDEKPRPHGDPHVAARLLALIDDYNTLSSVPRT
ncbi:sulfatase-like hydrolase/transferase [Streptomyces sp. NPDC028722]|uniref:sulfatase-like hydrolase/transferase n=1 Tax=Streptomyces sp. NPDC028722 TaxID=3155016 RepID=UPI0033D62E1E